MSFLSPPPLSPFLSLSLSLYLSISLSLLSLSLFSLSLFSLSSLSLFSLSLLSLSLSSISLSSLSPLFSSMSCSQLFLVLYCLLYSFVTVPYVTLNVSLTMVINYKVTMVISNHGDSNHGNKTISVSFKNIIHESMFPTWKLLLLRSSVHRLLVI